MCIKSVFNTLNQSLFTRNTSFFLFQNLNGASKPCLKYSLVLMSPKSSRPLKLAINCSRCSSQSLKQTTCICICICSRCSTNSLKHITCICICICICSRCSTNSLKHTASQKQGLRILILKFAWSCLSCVELRCCLSVQNTLTCPWQNHRRFGQTPSFQGGWQLPPLLWGLVAIPGGWLEHRSPSPHCK